MSTVHSYIEQKQIKRSELISMFTKVGENELGQELEHTCLFCGDEVNTKYLPSQSWTRALYCWKCGSITFKLVSDRMGGANTDIYEIYR